MGYGSVLIARAPGMAGEGLLPTRFVTSLPTVREQAAKTVVPGVRRRMAGAVR